MSTITASHTFVSDPFAGQSPFVVEEARRGLSRRTFLAAFSAVSVATFSGCGVGGSDPQDIAAGSGAGEGAGHGRSLGSGDTRYVPTSPFALTATCELSEDYFLVQNHLVDPVKDKVVAYSRTDGLVEAMVLQDGIVKQIYRDATQPGGWNVNPVPDAEGVTQLVAGVSTPTSPTGPPILRVFYTKTQSDQLWVASQPFVDGQTDTNFAITHVPWSTDAAGLQMTPGVNGSLLVAAMQPSTSPRGGDAELWFCYDDGQRLHQGTMTGFSYDPRVSGHWAAVAARYLPVDLNGPQLYLYVPGGFDQNSNADPNVHLWKGSLKDNKQIAVLQDYRFGTLTPPSSRLDIDDVAFAAALSGGSMPTALVWTVHDYQGMHAGVPQLWVVTWAPTGWVWTELVLPASINRDVGGAFPITTALTGRSRTSASSSPGDRLLDVFIVVDGVLHVLRQVEQATLTLHTQHPVYTPFIPLQPGVAAMTSQAAVSTGNELLVIGTDHALQTLEKDPVSGRWVEAELQLPAQSLQQDSAYRVTLTLVDVAWNVPVPNQALTVTASTSAPATVDAPSGHSTVVLGSQPVTLTTDDQGEVALALLADGLSAPTLTITADGLDKPVTVHPSGPLNAYMTGEKTQKLNYLEPLSGPTLSEATTTDGEVVPKSGKAGCDDAATTMSQAATFATEGAALGRSASTVGRIDGGRAHLARHRRPGDKPKAGAGVGVKGAISSIDHWGHDALHGIKKGAIGVSKIAVDAEKKIVTIAVDLADWADNAISIVVHDIEDAAHVLHAAFNKLGADIVHAVKWLEAEVIGVFTSAKRLSDHFETWIQSFSQFASGTLAADKLKVVTWLQNEQRFTHDKLEQLVDRFPAKTTLSNMAKNPPGPLTGSSRRPTRPKSRKALLGSDDDQQPTHGDWFYNKIKHELARSGLKFDLSNSPDVQNKLTAFNNTSKKGSSTDFRSAFTDNFWNGFIKTVVTKPDDVNDISVHALLHTLVSIVDKAFAFAEDIVDAAFDLLQAIVTNIPALLSGTTLKDLPILGALMRLVGLGDVSIGRVANLIFAFPAALVYKIAHGAHAEPFASGTPAGPREGTLGDVAGDLQICAASVMGTWAVFDTLSAAFVAGGDDGGLLFNAIDIAAPLIVTILTTPATQDSEPFFAPPVSGDVADVMGFLAWIFGAVPAACAALPLVIDKFFKDQGSKELLQATVWFQSLTGVLALVFGMVGNSQKPDPKGADYGGAVLNNMPTIAGAGLSDILIESTVGVSVVVAMALTLICGGLGAGVYGALG